MYVIYVIFCFADWLGNEIDLIAAGSSTEPLRHEITLLLDKTFVVILIVTNTTAAVSVCFDVKDSVQHSVDAPPRLIVTVKRCHKFIFTLFSNGCVCILFFFSLFLFCFRRRICTCISLFK